MRNPDVLIVQNIEREGPGLLAGVLRAAGVSFDVVDSQRAHVDELRHSRAVVMLGGPDSANDHTEKMSDRLALARAALAAKIPFLGICLGLQVLVKAAGGRVVKADRQEVGFVDEHHAPYALTVTGEGHADPLLTGLPGRLEVFQLHGETVELTPTMQILATGAQCRNQIVKVAPNAYGIQPHFELTSEMLAVWAEHDPDLKPIGAAQLMAEFEAIHQPYTQMGERLLRNFLRIAELVD